MHIVGFEPTVFQNEKRIMSPLLSTSQPYMHADRTPGLWPEQCECDPASGPACANKQSLKIQLK